MIRLRKRPSSRKFNDQRQQLQQAYDGMNGNANFTTPNPLAAAFATLNTNFHNAALAAGAAR
ncbi:MAG: hypothetical protein ACRD3R_00600 [Terriglobales bacterium]